MARAIICLSLLLLCPALAFAGVIPGVDVLAKRNFDLLQGRQIGLITNHTGRSLNGESTIDIIAKAPGVRLAAIFSPEHGLRGEADEKLSSGYDLRTGLPVYSLYGKSCRPTPEMLETVDMLVFDIQDIGARFYTYIGTLHHALKAAKEKGIPLVVLDRPNPIDGITLAGAVPEPSEVSKRIAEDLNGCRSLTVTHPIPTRHGMTVAELALMINRENAINADLQIVKMDGWQRTMLWTETGLKWINPSPNMKDPVAAVLYPGVGVLEATNLSVARGTDRPFHRYGAPWLDSASVLKKLPAMQGIRFSTTSFIPTAPGHPYQGKLCQGIELTVTDLKTADPVLAGLHLAQAIYLTHPTQYQVRGGFHGMVGDKTAWSRLTKERESPEKIASGWKEGILRFKATRKAYLLY